MKLPQKVYMNQPYARLNAHHMVRSRARKVLLAQLYENYARALLLCILSILNLDWLQHARSV